MAKITITFIIIIISQSCVENKKYSYNAFLKDKYNIIISGSIFSTEYNLNDNTIVTDVISKKLRDTLILEKSEKDFIVNSLSKNGFFERKGEFRIIGKNLISPSNDDKIMIYNQNKLISTYIINRNFESEHFFPSSEEKKIVESRECILKLLSTKKKYILMRKNTQKVLEETGVFTL
jgi:predicted transcriptional regulator YheO